MEGYVPYYIEKDRGLAIDSEKYGDKVAAAETPFKGKDGVYNIEITTLCEDDGESTFTLFVNNKEIGSYQNPEEDESRRNGERDL